MKYPTLQQYQQAINSADNEDDKARDTSKLMEYLSFFASSNSRLQGHIKTRQTAITSWGWSVVDLNNQRLPDIELRITKGVAAATEGVVRKSLFGNFLGRLSWALVNGTDWIATPELIRQRHIESLNNGSLLLRDGDKKTQINPFDPNYFGMTDNLELRGGSMRSIGETEIMRRKSQLEWGNYNNLLKGLLQAIDKGADDQEWQTAIDALKAVMAGNNFLGTSENIGLEARNLVTAAGSSFKDFKEGADADIAIAVLGQANTAQLPSGSGSRAALQVQAMVSADIMYCDVQDLEKVVNEQLLVFDAIKNNGTVVPKGRFKVNITEPVDYEQNAIIIREALASGVPLKKSEVYEKIGFSEPVEKDEIFQAAVSRQSAVISQQSATGITN